MAACRRGFTLIEVMIVVGLFSVLFGVMVGIMYNSDLFFKKGQEKIAQQVEARKVLDILARTLRPAAPNWNIGGVSYPLAASNNFTRLDFYVPEFDSDNALSGVKKVTYKLDPVDPSRLLMKQGTDPEQVLSEALLRSISAAGASAAVRMAVPRLLPIAPSCGLKCRLSRETSSIW